MTAINNMQIGIFVGAAPTDHIRLAEIIVQGVQAELDGFHSFWLPHISARGPDALAALALIGARTGRIALGTGVVPTYPRHPAALAQQALTTQIAANGRLTLGVGPSHKPGIEDALGLSYDRPAKHTREYIAVLSALMSDGRADFDGEVFRVHTDLALADALPVPLMISALAPQMLRLAGAATDGTITWMAGVRAIDTHIVPRVNAAALDAGRKPPRVAVGLPVAVADDEHAAREQVASLYGRYGSLVNYRRILDVEEAEGPSEVAVVGSESDVERQLRAFADAGATEFIASVFPVGDDPAASISRTRALLKSLAASQT